MRDHAPVSLSAETLIGNDVRNAEGESLGEIKDFVLDVRTGQCAYAVLDFGGLFGIGNKLFAVPFEAMTLNTVDHCFVLSVDKERLENAPGFAKDDWPSHADHSFINEARAFYGLDPFAAAN